MIQQTPWNERSFDLNFPTGLFTVLFSRLEGTLFRLSSILAAADDEACSYNAEAWSVKQHLGHLYDLEELWMKRLHEFTRHQPVLSAADGENTKTETAGHNEKTLEQLMMQFTTERQKLLESVYELDETTLSLKALHPRLNQSMRLIDSLYFIAEHDDHHIAAISNLLRKPSAYFVE